MKNATRLSDRKLAGYAAIEGHSSGCQLSCQRSR